MDKGYKVIIDIFEVVWLREISICGFDFYRIFLMCLLKLCIGE